VASIQFTSHSGIVIISTRSRDTVIKNTRSKHSGNI
jgi:hypothetical protein